MTKNTFKATIHKLIRRSHEMGLLAFQDSKLEKFTTTCLLEGALCVDCEGNNPATLFYGYYKDRTKQFDFIFCYECGHYFEINTEEDEPSEQKQKIMQIALQKVMDDLTEQMAGIWKDANSILN